MRWGIGSMASALAITAATFGGVALTAAERAEPPRPDFEAMSQLEFSPTHADGLDASLRAARTQLVPALGDRGAELGGALARLSAALAAPDRAGLADAVSGADAALARLEAEKGQKSAPDLRAVGLMLADARLLLKATGETGR